MESLASATATVITVSDSKSRGESEDQSGPEAVKLLESYGARIMTTSIVADDAEEIRNTLIDHCERLHVNLIITTGGTGVAPRDVTPEATSAICEKLVPGIPELLRKVAMEKTPHGALSRAVAGIRSQTLIVNLPGSPGGVRDSLVALESLLPHAISLIKHEPTSHQQT